MNTLLSRLILYVNTCVKKDVIYEISNYIINNYMRCQEITVKDIMNECFVSRTSVTRFYEYFGFYSWDSFQASLIKMKLIKEQQIINRLHNENIEALYDRLCLIAQNETMSFRDEVKSAVTKLSALIANSDRIHFFGAVYPLSLALEFQINLISLGKVVYNNYQSGNNESADSQILKANDLVIILTASGRFIAEAHAKFNTICNASSKTVIITCHDRYRNLQFVDQYIYIPTSNISSFSDFDYYVILILDLVFLEYGLKYYRGS